MSYHSDAPNVNFATVVLVFHDFRSHIHWAAKSLLKTSNRIAESCESEVCKLNSNFAIASVGVDQDIFGFDVSMHDVLLVHVVDS